MFTDRLKNPAVRRYLLRFSIAMVFYVVAIVSTVDILIFTHPPQVIRILLSLLPSIPIIAVIVIVGLYLKEETDEFERELLQRSLLWSIGATLAFTSVWGFLEMFSHVRHIPLFYVFVIFWIFVGIFGGIERMRYRSCDE